MLGSYPFQQWRVQSEENERDIQSKEQSVSCGTLGPGAEPPVAVASHAFAHDGRDGSRKVRADPTVEGERRRDDPTPKTVQSSSNIDHVGSPSGYEQTEGHGEFGEACDDYLERDSVVNNEEAETLADCYEILDAGGLEGSQTARQEDVSAPPPSPPLKVNMDHDRSDGRSSTGSNAGEQDSSARYGSESSEDELSPPYRQWRHEPQCGGRKQVRQRLFVVSRNRRIAPFESNSIAEGPNSRKHVQCRTRTHGSPSRQSWRTDALRRQTTRQRRPKRSAIIPKSESAGEEQRCNSRREMTSRLLRGSKTERSARRRRRPGHVADTNHEGTRPPGAWNSASESGQRGGSSSRVHEHSGARIRRGSRSYRQNYDRVYKDCHYRCLNPADRKRGRAFSTARRSGHSDSTSSPRPSLNELDNLDAADSLEGAMPKVANLCLPRILIEGGFLWKVPYHHSGPPKCRWFQIKPSGGLLTTASGRLLIRPRGRGVTMAPAGARGESDYGLDGDVGHVEAAWPLTLIWMDPDKDLERDPPREMDFGEMVELRRGHTTPAFWQQAVHRGTQALPPQELCFSLIGHERTLDLVAGSVPEAKQWVKALATLTLGDNLGQFPRWNPCGSAFPVDKWAIRQGCAQGKPNNLEAAERPPTRVSSIGLGTIDVAGATSKLGEREGLNQDQDQDQDQNQNQMGQERRMRGVYHGSGDSTDIMPPKTSRSSKSIRVWRRQLFPAILRGDAAAVVGLFNQGCPPDIVQPGTGDTALVLACRVGDVRIARECLQRGSRNHPHADFGQTALQAAVATGGEGCARLLLETAAPSLSDGIIANDRYANRQTPLHVACRHGYVGIAQALLNHGADIRAVDQEGKTPIHLAAADGRIDALACLIDVGGDAHLEDKDLRGNRPLHCAAASGHYGCVQLLLETAAEPDVPNAEGRTPFALASIRGHLDVTRLIRQYATEARKHTGGDMFTQELFQKGSGGDIALPDALPRPHSTHSMGWTTTSYRSPLSNSRDIVDSAHSGEGTNGASSYPMSTSAHGSLFDGLLVYVSGERQLSGPHTNALIRGVGPFESHDHRRERLHSTEHDSSKYWASSSCASVPTLPTCESPAGQVAPRPPVPPTEGVVPWPAPPAPTSIPGGARALARAIHFGSVGNSPGVGLVTASCQIKSSPTASIEGTDGEQREPAIGSWMRPQEQDSQVEADRVHECALETRRELPGSSEVVGHLDQNMSVTASLDDADQSFTLSGSGPFAGLWYIGYSQGYPYYLHEPSGHSQWEDPRLPVPRIELRSCHGDTSPKRAGSTIGNVSSAIGAEKQRESGRGVPPNDAASAISEERGFTRLSDDTAKTQTGSPFEDPRGRVDVGGRPNVNVTVTRKVPPREGGDEQDISETCSDSGSDGTRRCVSSKQVTSRNRCKRQASETGDGGVSTDKFIGSEEHERQQTRLGSMGNKLRSSDDGDNDGDSDSDSDSDGDSDRGLRPSVDDVSIANDGDLGETFAIDVARTMANGERTVGRLDGNKDYSMSHREAHSEEQARREKPTDESDAAESLSAMGQIAVIEESER